MQYFSGSKINRDIKVTRDPDKIVSIGAFR